MMVWDILTQQHEWLMGWARVARRASRSTAWRAFLICRYLVVAQCVFFESKGMATPRCNGAPGLDCNKVVVVVGVHVLAA